MTFLTNRFSRLISLLTSTIFVSGTSSITAILKYWSVNSITVTGDNIIAVLFAFDARSATEKTIIVI